MDSGNPNPHRDPPIAIVAITRNGVQVAMRLQANLPGSVCYVPRRHHFAVAMGAEGFDRLGQLFPVIWDRFGALVCIMATGIVVRLIAPLLRHKATDPAVVVVDERARYVISLVSGHLGGANDLARKIADLTGGRPVITTASDVEEKPSIDVIAKESGLEIENLPMLPRIARAILEDEPLWVFDPDERLTDYLTDLENVLWWNEKCLFGSRVALPERNGFLDHADESSAFHAEGGFVEVSADWRNPSRSGAHAEPGFNKPGEMPKDIHDIEDVPGIWISERLTPPNLRCLVLRPWNLVAGLGCNRGTGVEEILELMIETFGNQGLAMRSIRNLASVDLKSGEPGLLEAAKILNRPIQFYPRIELESVVVPNPSHVVESHIGVQSVCEAAALLSAQSKNLLIPKRKTANATLAVARVSYRS